MYRNNLEIAYVKLFWKNIWFYRCCFRAANIFHAVIVVKVVDYEGVLEEEHKSLAASIIEGSLLQLSLICGCRIIVFDRNFSCSLLRREIISWSTVKIHFECTAFSPWFRIYYKLIVYFSQIACNWFLPSYEVDGRSQSNL
jgi:hypothetical protein